MNRRIAGALSGLIAASIWGGMYVVSDAVLDVVPPATLVLTRYVIALPVLWIAARMSHTRGIQRPDWPLLALTAFVGFGVSLLAQFAGTKLSTAAAGALITSATPAFIVLFAWWILHERASGRQWIGLGIATVGVLIVSLLGEQATTDTATNPLLGNLLLIVAAVSWALYSVLVKLSSQKYTALAITLAVTACGIPIVAPVAAIELQTQSIGPLTLPAMLGILYIGIGSTAIAFFLWNKSFELLDAATASLFFFAQPVVGTLLAAIFRGEQVGWPFFVGGALILLGTLLGMATPQSASEAASHDRSATHAV
ncbi:MAG TPA: DMT family transporter [Anaerolineae bacterium]|nr:DMT family transporter [Anaerolineae bacterium]